MHLTQQSYEMLNLCGQMDPRTFIRYWNIDYKHLPFICGISKATAYKWIYEAHKHPCPLYQQKALARTHYLLIIHQNHPDQMISFISKNNDRMPP